MGIHSVEINNFKSIRASGKVELSKINVLIGPNGAGKSNFINFLKFLNRIYEQRAQLYINQHGRAENFLYFGIKQSKSLSGTIAFDSEFEGAYSFELVPDQSGSLIFRKEHAENNLGERTISKGGNDESFLKTKWGAVMSLTTAFNSFKVFHFHDTGSNSAAKQPCNTRDYAFLHEDGGNLAAFLFRLQEAEPKRLKEIEYVIRSIAPFFDGFYLQPDEINPEQIFLRWREIGSEKLFNAHNLSDGTLRMICLCTLLMQPDSPKTIIIDEPELGLHPTAIHKLGAMIKSASIHSQIIISTQSVALLDEFEPEDVLVVERQDDQSVFKRLGRNELATWLDEYSLGQLWEMNIFGGKP